MHTAPAEVVRAVSDLVRRARRAQHVAEVYDSVRVDEDSIGEAHPFSGEKLCPVLAVYGAADFDAAADTVGRLYAHQGAGHSVGLHSRWPGRALPLGGG